MSCACLIVKRWLKTDTAVAVLLSPEKRRAAARCAKSSMLSASEFSGKKVLLVDDSIVRGTTGQELVYLAREAGARQVYLASAAPPVRYPNVYGIDLSTRRELLAVGRDEKQIAAHLGADLVIYQSLEDLQAAISDLNGNLTEFEASCFNGYYSVGDVDENYLKTLEKARGAGRDENVSQLNLPLTRT